MLLKRHNMLQNNKATPYYVWVCVSLLFKSFCCS